MPQITINGKNYEFKQGQTVIQAALENGIDIPHFCWHPELSVSGNCRMCLVEIERLPKLAIACSTLAADGMVVNVQSEKSVAAREAVMEFILINHPLDCPICDEAGECKLQDYAFKHSIGESRFVELKNSKDKRVELGPRIMFDGERCISCSRCIRFTDEIAKSPQLTFVQRGDRITINTFPGESFDNNYTLNTTDICPVGALTSKDFRFDSRVWELSNTKSVCVGCSRGCNTDIWVRDNKIKRLTPRFNKDVNNHWMCDEGRLNTFKFVHSDQRITSPMMKADGKLKQTDWIEAINYSEERLKNFKPDEIAFVGSPFATIEDNYILSKLSKRLNCKNLFVFEEICDGAEDDLLVQADKSPNLLGAKLTGMNSDMAQLVNQLEMGKIKALYILENYAEFNADLESAFGKAEFIICHSVTFNKFVNNADIIFPASSYAEKNGTFINFAGIVQRIYPAVATLEADRALDNMEMSRWDKFGTSYDSWANGKKINSKPSWKIISLLLLALGEKISFTMAEEVFDELSEKLSDFNKIDYDVIGEGGARLKSYQIIENEIVSPE